jgi:phage shock protein PspC (stress-responsive transcriptional regulator)
MTNTSPPPPAEPGPADHHDLQEQQGPRTSRNEILELGRLRRTQDRHIAGVAGGIARHLDIDPIIVRVALVVLVFFGGSGLLLYGAAWLLVPEEGSAAQPLGLDDRNRNIALLGTGVLAAIAAVGDFAGAFWFPWPVVIVGLLVVWFLNRKEKREQQPSSYSTPVSGYGSPASGYVAPGAPGAPAAAAYSATEQPSWQTQTMPVTDAPGQPYQAPYQPYQAYVKPRNPRKKGPILFWFTLALIATGVGTLGIIDVSGTSVPDAAYPALAMSLTGAMLLLGAFWGRAGGLIFIGLVAAAATLGATATDNYDGTRLTYTPTSSSEVRDSYELGAGELTLDLSQVGDVEGLDGRELSIDGGIGEIEVIVPDGMDVTVDATTGVGDVSVFGEHDDGFDITRQNSLNGGSNVPQMSITIDHGVGQVTVREQ